MAVGRGRQTMTGLFCLDFLFINRLMGLCYHMYDCNVTIHGVVFDPSP